MGRVLYWVARWVVVEASRRFEIWRFVCGVVFAWWLLMDGFGHAAGEFNGSSDCCCGCSGGYRYEAQEGVACTFVNVPVSVSDPLAMLV